MTGSQLCAARKARDWNQQELANHLAMSQGYVSLMESNRRPVPAQLARRLAALLELPPTSLPSRDGVPFDAERSSRALGALGYEGFAYWRDPEPTNPAELLVRTLGADHLDARVVTALPWLVRTYANLDWDWVVPLAKQSDLQNRLGLVVCVARGLAEADHDGATTTVLKAVETRLENSRLQKHDSFARQSLTRAEERWLRVHSSPEAKHWNMLSTLGAHTSRHG